MTEQARVNPFCDRGRWYWRSETQNVNGPYDTQIEALTALLRYCNPRTRWQRLWDAWLEFIHA